MTKLIIWVIVAAIVVGGYLLLSRSPSVLPTSEQGQLSDLDYLLDNSVSSEVLDALNETASVSGLDKQALAAEADQLTNLPDTSVANQIYNYVNEIGK